MQTEFEWYFIEIPTQIIQSCLNPQCQYTLFRMIPLFQKYLYPQVGVKKMQNSNAYHPFPSRLASRIHPFIFL